MPSEGTPLTKENLVKAGDYISEKATSLTNDGNSTPLLILTVLGGVGMVISSAIALFGKVILLDFFGVILECVCAALGVVIILLEVNQKLPTPVSGFEDIIEERCKFLQTMTGKAGLYALSGLLKILMVDLINLIIGLFMFFLAFIAYMIGRKRSEYSEMISIAV